MTEVSELNLLYKKFLEMEIFLKYISQKATRSFVFPLPFSFPVRFKYKGAWPVGQASQVFYCKVPLSQVHLCVLESRICWEMSFRLVTLLYLWDNSFLLLQ